MKRLLAVFILVIMVFSLSSCAKSSTEWKSEVYSDKEIESAIKVAKSYFKKEFRACTLTTITYIGDDKISAYKDWATRNNADEVIVLTSSFNVDSSGGDGSLTPNSTYDN